jgi:hypothetical protein
MAWLQTRAPNGDRAEVSRCKEGDHAGRIREVPQERYSPSMNIAQLCVSCKEEFQLTANCIANIAEKVNIREVTMITLPVYA